MEIRGLNFVQCLKKVVNGSDVYCRYSFLNYHACSEIQVVYIFEIIIPMLSAFEPLYSIYVYVLSSNYIPFICFLISYTRRGERIMVFFSIPFFNLSFIFDLKKRILLF